jgi:hypothetical protein
VPLMLGNESFLLCALESHNKRGNTLETVHLASKGRSLRIPKQGPQSA